MTILTDKKKKIAQKNFLELLRNAQEETANSRQESTLKKEQFFRRFQEEFQQVRPVEKLVFNQADQEIKLQVTATQEELKKLALSTQNLAKEVETAAVQTPVNPGIYHLNFFERLRQKIILLKKKIDESATWLGEFNQRSAKRNYYWAQVKKSGTKFMLSQERYMATQAG